MIQHPVVITIYTLTCRIDCTVNTLLRDADTHNLKRINKERLFFKNHVITTGKKIT